MHRFPVRPPGKLLLPRHRARRSRRWRLLRIPALRGAADAGRRPTRGWSETAPLWAIAGRTIPRPRPWPPFRPRRLPARLQARDLRRRRRRQWPHRHWASPRHPPKPRTLKKTANPRPSATSRSPQRQSNARVPPRRASAAGGRPPIPRDTATSTNPHRAVDVGEPAVRTGMVTACNSRLTAGPGRTRGVSLRRCEANCDGRP
jgi:hypothetical protein